MNAAIKGLEAHFDSGMTEQGTPLSPEMPGIELRGSWKTLFEVDAYNKRIIPVFKMRNYFIRLLARYMVDLFLYEIIISSDFPLMENLKH